VGVAGPFKPDLEGASGAGEEAEGGEIVFPETETAGAVGVTAGAALEIWRLEGGEGAGEET